MFLPNQQRHPNQTADLCTDRIVSTIPKKSSENSQWVYPSPQMFFNAMKKKGWKPEERDMEAVVTIHNHVNESTWGKIKNWESLHSRSEPTLLRFMGRPDELTPKARFM